MRAVLLRSGKKRRLLRRLSVFGIVAAALGIGSLRQGHFSDRMRFTVLRPRRA